MAEINKQVNGGQGLSFDDLVARFADLMVAQIDAEIARKSKIKRKKDASVVSAPHESSDVDTNFQKAKVVNQ